ncbi:PREDICTED: B3 domain-containing protein At2g33720-like isoform 2 [Fragaria vesca subsp. vesca]|uniref:B3 domain-containing protein At2g33720-like n=1 Tax=Fragaria vesca subsp. vesca TaxID=101020 RepID=UPI0002C31746|nr:PREDICTED: B3 domain-containing protein At2g33720-like [Fragaria vesca subsp. vesca]
MMAGGEQAPLSLELTLGGPWVGEPWVSADTSEEYLKMRKICMNLMGFKVYSLKDEADETEAKVCTRLALCSSFDPWIMKKPLGHHDIIHRLCLRKLWMDRDVLPNLNEQAKHEMDHDDRTIVQIYDADTQSNHEVELRSEAAGIFFRASWIQNFVDRRQLKQGDAIGIYWETGKHRSVFSVLKRAPRTREELLRG